MQRLSRTRIMHSLEGSRARTWVTWPVHSICISRSLWIGSVIVVMRFCRCRPSTDSIFAFPSVLRVAINMSLHSMCPKSSMQRESAKVNWLLPPDDIHNPQHRLLLSNYLLLSLAFECDSTSFGGKSIISFRFGWHVKFVCCRRCRRCGSDINASNFHRPSVLSNSNRRW